MRFVHKGLILVAVPLIFELFFIVYLAGLLNKAEKEVSFQAHSHEIVSTVETASIELYWAMANVINYFNSHNKNYWQEFQHHRSVSLTGFDHLSLLVEDNPDRRLLATDLSQRGRALFQVLDQILESTKNEDSNFVLFKGLQMNRSVNKDLSTYGEVMQRFLDFERENTSGGKEKQLSTKAAVSLTLACGLILNVLTAIALAVVFTRSTTRRLNALVQNSYRLAASEPLLDPIPNSDELGFLDQTFHSMAGVLREAARKEQAIVENSLDVICTLDGDGKVSAVNSACEKIWGYKSEDLIGTRLFTSFDSGAAETMKFLEVARTNENERIFENEIKRRDGTIANMLWSTYWSDENNAYFCVGHDITSRKTAEDLLRENEARIRLLIENMPVAMVGFDHAGAINTVNSSTETLFGYTREELLGASLPKLFTEVERDRNLLEKTTKKEKVELTGVTRDGTKFPLYISINEYESTTGSAMLANIVDITQERKVEQLRRDFVAMVTHDLRTPLTSIQLSLDLINLIEGNLADQSRTNIKIAQRGIIRLLQLVNELLDFEKLEAGALTIFSEAASVAEIIEASIDSVSGFAEKKGVRLECSGEDFELNCDAKRIIQVLVNLLSNAIKFSSKGASIELVVEKESQTAKFTVRDEGPGIPNEKLATIFDRYQQVSPGREIERQGTGLGLAICKAIVEKHGGKIDIDSELGKGSSFTVVIPR